MAATNIAGRARASLEPFGRRVFKALPDKVRAPVGRRLVNAGLAAAPIPDADHPERLAVLEHVTGDCVIEIGCGPRKTAERFLGIDLTPGGVDGSVGNASGRSSQADVCADGAVLPLLTASADCVVARHNLEHYVDTIATLREWERVLVPNGRVVVVVPDEDAYSGRTVELDPTHYHSFNSAYLVALFELLGWSIVLCEPCVPGWSLLLVAQAPDASTA